LEPSADGQSKLPSNGQSKTFSPDYDLADQLVSSLVQITKGSSGTQSQYGYSYDKAGNRTGFQSDLTVASAQANWLNQLTQITTGQGPLTVFGNTNRPSTVSVNGVSAKNWPLTGTLWSFLKEFRTKFSSTILRLQCSSILLEKDRSFILGTWTLQHITPSSHGLVTCDGQTKKAVSNPVLGT
jgi:hypothetical protein